MTKEHYVDVICDDPIFGDYNKDGVFELAKIECWLCPGCDRVMDWEFGCAHEDPVESSFCDDCWVERYGRHIQGSNAIHHVKENKNG